MPRNRSEKLTPEQLALIDYGSNMVKRYKGWGTPLPETWSEAQAICEDRGWTGIKQVKVWDAMGSRYRDAVSACKGPIACIEYIGSQT